MLFPDLKMRWSLLRILIHLIHEGMQHFTIDSGCVAFYLHVCLVFFTPSCRLIVDKRYLKNKCLFMVVTCQIISSLEQSSATVCWYPPFTIFSIYNFFSLCALRILDPTLRTEPTSKIALYYFHNWIIWHLLHQFILFVFFCICLYLTAKLPTFSIKLMQLVLKIYVTF